MPKNYLWPKDKNIQNKLLIKYHEILIK